MADELLMAYSALNESYQSGLVKKIEGPAATDTDTVAQINNPDETYVPLGPKESDPKLFSYAYGQDPAVLVARVTTDLSTQISSCKYTLTAPDAGGGKAWKVLARDVVLQSGGGNVATNPFGVAQVGTMLYLIDYDSQKICPLGVNELNGLPAGNYTLAYPPFDLGLSTTANLPANAKGQAIIALKDSSGNSFLYALYTVADLNPYPQLPDYYASILVRLQVGTNPYGLVYVDQVSLALNAQELIPVTLNGAVTLLIPSIGGPQKSDGTTNGTNSKIEAVSPFASSLSATPRFTGDAAATPPTAWDIRAIAAPAQDDYSGEVFILTGTMDTSYNQNWTLYRGPLGRILAASNATLSAAVSAGTITVVNSGTGSPGSYWDIYMETGTARQGNRLWFLRGSPIQVVSAMNYSSTGGKNFDTGYGTGDIGGINVDSAVLIAETMRQAALGVSYKRGLRGAPAPVEAEEEK
jgi:hypothetical protein